MTQRQCCAMLDGSHARPFNTTRTNAPLTRPAHTHPFNTTRAQFPTSLATMPFRSSPTRRSSSWRLTRSTWRAGLGRRPTRKRGTGATFAELLDWHEPHDRSGVSFRGKLRWCNSTHLMLTKKHFMLPKRRFLCSPNEDFGRLNKGLRVRF